MDSRSFETDTKGYGALRGQFVIREGLDVTKPIFEQVLKLEKKDRRKPKQ